MAAKLNSTARSFARRDDPQKSTVGTQRNSRRPTSAVALLSFLLIETWSQPSLAVEPVTAIDVLLLPDQTMIERATAANARLRENYPAGFALDATHRPHITLLQRYARTKDLDKVYVAVSRVFDKERPAGWQLEATGYYDLNFNGMGLAGIVIKPTPELRRLQQEIIDAVAPYTAPDGTSAAYVTTPDLPAVNAPTLQYVKTFVTDRSGPNFNPHVTVGVGQLDFVTKMKAAPFKTFKFKVAGAAVFHLGNFGTAQKKLWGWKGPDEKSYDGGHARFDGVWTLVECNGKAVADRDISLQFDTTAGRASGSTGVNRWNGSYSLSGQSIEFGPIVATRRAGTPEAMQLEREFTQALHKVTQISSDDRRFVLSEGDNELLVFERSQK